MTKSNYRDEYRRMLRLCPDKPPCYDCEGKGKSTGVDYCSELKNGKVYQCDEYRNYIAKVNH